MKLKKSTYFFKIKRLFTLMEMIVTLAVFMILIAVVLNFYDSIFKASSSSRNSSDVFSNARTAMDVITRDIQCIYYKNGMIPFWHKGPTGDGRFSNDLLAFISATPLPQSSGLSSKLCEIKYQLFPYDSDEDSAGYILRSVTGDDSDSWNFQYNSDTAVYDTPSAAFTADTSSSEEYMILIPYVTNLRFECYDKEGGIIYSSADEYREVEGVEPFGETFNDIQFPYSIRVILTLMDEISWKKYKTLTAIAAKNKVLRENSRTFSKTIFIGEHGQ